MIWLDRAPIETALAQSNNGADNTAVTVVIEQLARVPADNVEIELNFSDRSWESIFQDIVRRSPTLRYVTAVTSFTCSKMRPDGWGGMAILITPSAVMGKSSGDIIEDFLNEAVPGWAGEAAKILSGHCKVISAPRVREKAGSGGEPRPVKASAWPGPPGSAPGPTSRSRCQPSPRSRRAPSCAAITSRPFTRRSLPSVSARRSNAN